MVALQPLKGISPPDAAGSYQNYSTLFSYSASRADSDSHHSRMPGKYQFALYANMLYAETAARGIAGILSSARKLQDAAERLRTDHPASAFASREAVSSDRSALRATAANGAERSSFRLQVDAVAAAQRNSGASFVRSGPTALAYGTHQLAIATNGHITNVRYDIRSTDTHEQALTRIKNAINASDSGVTAGIATDADGRIRLELTARETGTEHAFSIHDTNGNAVAVTGIDSIDRHAANAIYRIDGGAPVISQSNDVRLRDGDVNATLLRATASPATVQVKYAQADIAEKVKSLVNGYNDLIETTSEAGRFLNPSVMRGISQAFGGLQLDRVGISRNKDGTLALDESKLQDSIASRGPEVERTIGGSGGLAARLDKLAERLAASPAEALLDRRSAEYRRFANYRETLELYTQLPQDGMLLNRFM